MLLLLLLHSLTHAAQDQSQMSQSQRMQQALMALREVDMVLGSDLYDTEPRIMSANAELDNILGVQSRRNRANILVAGGGWNDVGATCPNGRPVPDDSQASAFDIGGIVAMFKCDILPDHDDVIPVCFSWPIRQSTYTPEAFKVTRSDGVVAPVKCVSNAPNIEMNERHCVTIFGDWMNRLEPGSPGFYEAATVEIVSDLELIGPNGPVSAVGLKFTSDTHKSTYHGTGPYFNAAKLNPLSNLGEGGSPALNQIFSQSWYPNGGLTLYPDGTHRLRLFYSGGMTPSGVGALNPHSFAPYYKLELSDGQEITQPNQPHTVGGTTVTVLGLADLGKPTTSTDDPCYQEDRDNYMDIILKIDGDSSVVKTVRAFDDKGLYNPGGPGTVNAGLPMTEAGHAQQLTVMNDPNNEMMVSWCGKPDGATLSMDANTCMQALQSGGVMSFVYGSLPRMQRLQQERAQAAAQGQGLTCVDLTGTWSYDGGSVVLTQSGCTGVSSAGGWAFMVSGFGQVNTNTDLVGQINQGATQITWSDNTVYTKVQQSCADISGAWNWAGGDNRAGTVTLQQQGCAGMSSAGWQYTVTETSATIGSSDTVGQISGDGSTIVWSNGFTYTRPQTQAAVYFETGNTSPDYVVYGFAFLGMGVLFYGAGKHYFGSKVGSEYNTVNVESV